METSVIDVLGAQFNIKKSKISAQVRILLWSLFQENFFQEKPANNNSTEKLAFIPGRKRPAPSTPSKDKNKEKRKAPPPPNPFTGEVDNDENYRPPTFRTDSSDLYERVCIN